MDDILREDLACSYGIHDINIRKQCTFLPIMLVNLVSRDLFEVEGWFFKSQAIKTCYDLDVLKNSSSA